MDILKFIKKNKVNIKAMTVFLAVIVFFSSLTLITSNVETTYAAEVPGTDAYYDARFEESKVRAGWLNANGTTITNAGPWNMDTGLPVWNGNGNAVPTTGAGTVANPYQVVNAQQLRYCVLNQKSFRLMNDINLGGYLGRNWTSPAITSTTAWTADGNGKTIYNFNLSTTGAHQSFFGQASNATIKNLRFKNAKLWGTGDANSLCVISSFASNIRVQNCGFEDIIVYMDTTALFAAVILIRPADGVIDNCYTDNCHVVIDSTFIWDFMFSTNTLWYTSIKHKDNCEQYICN